MAILFWSVILVLAVAAEVHTNAFVSLFIGVGAALSLVLAIVHVAFPLQALAWALVSLAGVSVLRPLAVRRFAHHSYEIDMTRPTHTSMTHLTGFVEEVVGGEAHPGRVKIQGESWRAVTEWPEPIAVGSAIVVDRTYGTTLWVMPA
jgi:membrane protein implicated in regulation of membrane protease activity